MPLPSPFLDSLRDALERVGDGPLAPALDLHTTATTFFVSVALPGVKSRDVVVTIDERLLTISGSINEEATGASCAHRELAHGSFDRRYYLPSAIDGRAATASFLDGLLTIAIPKADQDSDDHVEVRVV